MAGRKEEYCAPSPDKIEINNWDFSQRADLSSLSLNPSWMGALYPFCFPVVSVSFCSSQPMFTGRFKAAISGQEFFLALCFPSAVCFPLHTTDADGSPSVVSKETRCTLRGAGKLCHPQECSPEPAQVRSCVTQPGACSPDSHVSHCKTGIVDITLIHLLAFIHPLLQNT